MVKYSKAELEEATVALTSTLLWPESEQWVTFVLARASCC